MPTYSFTCDTCESIIDEFYKYEERPETIKCPCGGTASHTIVAVGLMIKEAYLDGHKRKGWTELKEASKLNKEKALQKTDADRKRIATQIKKLGVNFDK